ncbi:MAG TPA: hypothetical protein VK666_01705 [Chryseolinea sp.]|nr:hypothetical protein [Chryseolinea sp.]
MKKLIFACLLLVGAVVGLQAQDSTATESDRFQQQPTQDQQPAQDRDNYTEKDVIAASELPKPIQDQLKGQDYSGWTIDKAYRKMKDGKTTFAVELKNGTDKKKVKFDEQGNVLKEKG